VFGIGPWPAVGLDLQLTSGWGVDGIVAGTVTAKFCGAAIMLLCLARGVNHLKLDRREFRLRDEFVRRILRIGSLAAVDGAIMWAGQFLFLMIIANLEADKGDSYVFAAHIVGINIEAISYLPSIAWGMASATVIGQSLGAGDRDRAMAAGNVAIGQCALLLLAVSFMFYFGAEQIFGFMQKESRVVEVGVPAFRWLALFQIPLGIEIIYKSSLRGAGDTRYPMYFTALGVLCVRVPLAYLGGIVLDGGLLGAWAGMFADVTLRAVLHAVRYLRGNWTELAV
jgi:Na+-driven multidrug efflux pump